MKRELMIVAVMGLALFALPTTALAIDSFFDVFTELSVGPPYPTAPTETVVSHPEGGMWVSTQILDIGLKVVDNHSPARIAAHDSGGGGGGGGANVQSFFDIWTELSLDSYPIDSFFDIFIEVQPLSLGSTAPQIIQPLCSLEIHEGWDYFFTDIVAGGIESFHIHAEIGPGQPLIFTNVESQGAGDSWFDVWVGCRRTGGPLLPGVPLFTMTVTGNYVPEPATWMLLLLGGALTGLARKR
jgi:hypothetical protein